MVARRSSLTIYQYQEEWIRSSLPYLSFNWAGTDGGLFVCTIELGGLIYLCVCVFVGQYYTWVYPRAEARRKWVACGAGDHVPRRFDSFTQTRSRLSEPTGLSGWKYVCVLMVFAHNCDPHTIPNCICGRTKPTNITNQPIKQTNQPTNQSGIQNCCIERCEKLVSVRPKSFLRWLWKSWHGIQILSLPFCFVCFVLFALFVCFVCLSVCLLFVCLLSLFNVCCCCAGLRSLQ